MNLGPSVWIALLVFATIFSFAAGEVAGRKGYDRTGGYVLGFLLGFIGLFVVGVLPAKQPVTVGAIVKFSKRAKLGNGALVAKNYASMVYEIDVKDGRGAALINDPNGEQIWVWIALLWPE